MQKLLYSKTYVKVLMLVAILICCALFFYMNLKNLTIDTSIEGFFKEDDQILTAYNESREMFGKDDLIIVAVKSDDIFDLNFLTTLKDFYQAIEDQVPYIEDINSLYSARHTMGENDDLIIEDLSEFWPEKEADIEEFKRKVLSNPLLENLIISVEKNVILFGIRTQLYHDSQVNEKRRLLTDKDIENVINHLYAVIDKFEKLDSFHILMSGTPVTSLIIRGNMKKDIGMFSAISILIIIAILGILFRRIAAVIIPIFIVVLAILTTLSTMAMFQVPLTLPTQILPSFILSVGICYSLHFLIIFFENYEVREQKNDAIIKTIEYISKVILFTGGTTTIGIFSFSFAIFISVAEFGIFGSLGVVTATLYSVFLLPLLLAIFPIKPIVSFSSKANTSFSSRFLTTIGKFSVVHAKEIIFVTFIVVAISFFGISKLFFSHNPLTWLPDQSKARISTTTIDDTVNGSVSIDILIDTGVENGVKEPKFVKKLEKLQNAIAVLPNIGKVVSIVDVIKEVHKALNNGESLYFTIPDKKDIITQELLLFELGAKDDLERLVDDNYQIARLTVRIPQTNTEEYMYKYQLIENITKEIFHDTQFTLSGFIALVTQSVIAMIQSMITSYMITAIVITLMILGFCKTYNLGILAIFPNFIPIIIILGVMGIFQIPIDMFTLLIGSIAIGIAVDDTIHFLNHYHQYYLQGYSNEESVIKTLESSGKAIYFTTIILSGGFLVYVLSDMNSLTNFGLLTAATLILAFIADITLTPALVTTFYKPSTIDKKK